MQRRELIQWMVATGGLAVFNRLSVADLETVGRDIHRLPQARALRSLSTHAAQTVTIASERIIPKSDTPGATDAGTTAFIDTMLSDWYEAVDRDRFLAGVADLDVRSRAKTGRDFVSSTATEQVALLEALDGEVSALRRTRAAAANDHWFAMLKYLTVWGYCTSETAMRDTLHSYPPPMRYDGCAPIEIRRNTRNPSEPT
jgi:hypothetical protein